MRGLGRWGVLWLLLSSLLLFELWVLETSISPYLVAPDVTLLMTLCLSIYGRSAVRLKALSLLLISRVGLSLDFPIAEIAMVPLVAVTIASIRHHLFIDHPMTQWVLGAIAAVFMIGGHVALSSLGWAQPRGGLSSMAIALIEAALVAPLFLSAFRRSRILRWCFEENPL